MPPIGHREKTDHLVPRRANSRSLSASDRQLWATPTDPPPYWHQLRGRVRTLNRAADPHLAAIRRKFHAHESIHVRLASDTKWFSISVEPLNWRASSPPAR